MLNLQKPVSKICMQVIQLVLYGQLPVWVPMHIFYIYFLISSTTPVERIRVEAVVFSFENLTYNASNFTLG